MNDMQVDVAAAPRIVVVMTVFNRYEQTVSCIESLKIQQLPGCQFQISFVILDDGSTDGTFEKLSGRYGDKVRIVRVAGDLFWSRGMACAQSIATRDSPKFILWVNNDICLEEGTIERLLDVSQRFQHQAIVAGAMRSSSTEMITYTGYRSRRFRTSALTAIAPSKEPQVIDTFNGNLVLLPRSVYTLVGEVDSAFSHGHGDLDYGLRAKSLGIQSILAPGTFGVCDRNTKAGTWEDKRISRADRVRLLLSRKGLPFGSHVRYLRRHDPLLWPLVVLVTYGRRFAQILMGR